MATSALVGYTGYVGTTLRGQAIFDDLYNSANIAEIEGKHYDVVICAAAPAAKWIANQNPEADWENLQRLIGHLKQVTASRFILISTVDVYHTPVEVDELTSIKTDLLAAYGKHRFWLEEFVREQFPKHIVVRLPGLFGKGLRKNFLYDLVHHGKSDWTHCDSTFQFYNMANLWRDLQTVSAHDLSLINFATEPVKASDVAQHSFGIAYDFKTENPPVRYDMRSLHAKVFGSTTAYMAAASQVFSEIKLFAQAEKEP